MGEKEKKMAKDIAPSKESSTDDVEKTKEENKADNAANNDVDKKSLKKEKKEEEDEEIRIAMAMALAAQTNSNANPEEIQKLVAGKQPTLINVTGKKDRAYGKT